MQTRAVLYIFGVRLVRIKRIFYLGEAESFNFFITCEVLFSNRTRYSNLHQLLLGDGELSTRSLENHKRRMCIIRQRSCCFLISFEIRTVRAYLNKALIHAQTHSVIPLLNPSIGWDKDMMTT